MNDITEFPEIDDRLEAHLRRTLAAVAATIEPESASRPLPGLSSASPNGHPTADSLAEVSPRRGRLVLAAFMVLAAGIGVAYLAKNEPSGKTTTPSSSYGPDGIGQAEPSPTVEASADETAEAFHSAPGLPVHNLAGMATLSDAVVLGVGKSLGTVDLNGSFGRNEAEVFSLSVDRVLRGSVGSAGISVLVVDSTVQVPVGKPAVFLLVSIPPDDPAITEFRSVAANTELFAAITWNSILPVSGENIVVPIGSMRLHDGMPLERQLNLADAIDAIVAAPSADQGPVGLGPGVDRATQDWLLALNEMCAGMRPVVAELTELLRSANTSTGRLSPTESDRVLELSGKLATDINALSFGVSAVSDDIAGRWKRAESLINSIRTQLNTLPTFDGPQLTSAIDALHSTAGKFQLLWFGLNVNECRQFV